MKRDWNLIREILIAFEEDRFVEFVNLAEFNNDEQCAFEMKASALDPDGQKELRSSMRINKRTAIWKHVEMMQDCGLLVQTQYDNNNVNGGIRLSMQGADLLDVLRDQRLWPKIKKKAMDTGLALTWEFIKAAVPAIIKTQL